MHTPCKENPLQVAPQNGGAPPPTTGNKSDCCPSRPSLHSWRKTGQITSLVKFGHIGRRQFMELARLAVQLDAKLAPIVEDWDRMKPALRNAANLDALCEAHGVDPTHFISVVGEAAMRFRDNASIILAALSLPSVVQKSIEVALTDKGVKDREMLFQHSGFLPQPKGSQVGVLNNAAIRAEVNTNIGEPLLTFEETIELIGDEE